jgi:hypothetical protein
MTTLYPSPMTRRTIENAIANSKLILWIYDSGRTLFYNPTITSGPTAGTVVTPSDGGAAFGADYIVKGGTDGFASAARAAGLYTGSGLSSGFEDDSAAQNVWGRLTFVPGGVVSGPEL